MWNIKKLKKKMKYVLNRLENIKDPKEIEKLKLTLISYYTMLDNSGTFVNTKLPNILDKVTNNKYSNIKDEKLATTEIELFSNNKGYMDNDYLQFLIKLCDNISLDHSLNYDVPVFETFNISKEEVVNVSKNFYYSLGDKDIYQNALKILNDENSLNFSKISRIGFEDYKGVTLNDYIFDKSYCNISLQKNIFDYQILNHEVMHAVDFYMKKKLPSENYYGFHEVPTYTIDYLFLDYLENSGFPKNQIQILRNQKINYLKDLATITKMEIKRLLSREKGYKTSINPSISDISDVTNLKINKRLIELQSGIMAYGLYNQINQDKENGIINLKTFMKTIIPNNITPNFENIDLSSSILIEYSKIINSYLENTNQLEKNCI